MPPLQRTVVLGLLLLLATADAEPIVLSLRDSDLTVPADAETSVDRSKTAGRPDRSVSGRWKPTVTVYLPEKGKATGAAVVICPGGGYARVVIDKEGHDIARWLNSVGVAGVVLKYRLPRPGETKGGTPLPLLDAQRAIRLVRARAKEWGIDARRVGIAGFSAGGHLASAAGTHFDRGDAAAEDPVERQSCRPDFMVLGYPVVSMLDPIVNVGSRQNLIGDGLSREMEEKWSNELHVTAETPPAFIVHSKDDGVKVENSLRLAEAMRKAGVPCELMLLEKAGHGFGLGVKGGEATAWPGKCVEWMKGRGLLKQRE